MKNKTFYLISNSLLTIFMLISSGMYFFNSAEVGEMFTNLGYPSYIVYPLAIAKILGLIGIWLNKYKSLKEWAYAGFFFDFILALMAHIMAGIAFVPVMIALVLLGISYFTWKRKLTLELQNSTPTVNES